MDNWHFRDDLYGYLFNKWYVDVYYLLQLVGELDRNLSYNWYFDINWCLNVFFDYLLEYHLFFYDNLDRNLPDNRYVLHSFHLFCLFLHNFFDYGHLDVFDHLNTHLLYHLNRHVRYHLNRHFLHDDHLHRNLFEHDDLLNALDLD